MNCAHYPFEWIKAKYCRFTPPTSQMIIKSVCEEFNEPEHRVYMKTRNRHTVDTRHMIIFLLITHCGFTLQQAANTLGLKDHNTTWHAKEKVKALVYAPYDNEMKQHFLNLIQEIV